jgi:peroxiredoxin
MLSLGYNRGMDQKPLLQTGQTAPDFSLPDMDGHVYSTGDYRGQIVIINFWSAECPWSQRCDEQIIDLLQDWDAEVQYLPVASNRNEALELVQEVADERQLPLMLHDPDQKAADLYGAVTTPHIFVIDPDGILRYQGAFNDVSFRQPEPTVNYLQQAVEALRSGSFPDPHEIPSYGCTIVRALHQ